MQTTDMGIVLVQAGELREIGRRALAGVGVREDVADAVVEGLVWTSLRGIDSHGIRLLPHYIAGVKSGRLNPSPDMTFARTAPAVGMVDADHTFGHAAGRKAMEHAIELARDSGVGAVGVKNSSHCGAMSWFAHEAARQNMIGLAFTHATPRVKSPGSTRSFFGNNPICLVAPMQGEEPFCFDMATTSITFNAVKAAAAAGQTLPPDLIADKDGRMTTDPNLAEQLMPIGDYKGFGLSMMVDILCALLTGMPGGNQVSKMFGGDMSQKRELGHFFCAMNIAAFTGPTAFAVRLRQMADAVRAEPALDPDRPVMVPGDPEKRAWAERMVSGVPVPGYVWEEIVKQEEF
jgi:ureidoglycolate dehydrogenase (NAD+)